MGMIGYAADVFVQSFGLSWTCVIVTWTVEQLVSAWVLRVYRDGGRMILRLEDRMGINPLFGDESTEEIVMGTRFTGFLLCLTAVGWMTWFLGSLNEGEPVLYEFTLGLAMLVPMPSLVRLSLGLIVLRNLVRIEPGRSSVYLPTWILLQVAAALQLIGSLVWLMAWLGSGRWFFLGAFTGSLVLGMTHFWSALRRRPEGLIDDE